jgi:predicted amino acid racemase
VFLDVTRRRNPRLIEAAVELHRAGRIPSNCYVVDVDTVAHNAREVVRAAEGSGLQLYQMTKQFGRNPVVAQAIAQSGIDKVVAVDFEEARLLHRHGLTIGHLGHLVQVPGSEIARAVAMQPEVITVFGLPQAVRVAAAAHAAGRVQPVLIRVVGDGDQFYAGQRGGVPLDKLVEIARAVQALAGVTVAGVTSFPCLLWNEAAGRLDPTPNLRTVSEASRLLRDAGFDAPVVNAPSATCIASLGVLRAHGATVVEPGSCLTGHTPLHAVSDQPELPAMVYVTEVTHRSDDVLYALGGGYYPRSRAKQALVFGRDDEPVLARVELDPAEAIDYYGTLHVEQSAGAQVGDTVVYAFRSQVFVSRSFVAAVTFTAGSPEVVGIFDRGGFALGPDLLPVGS